MRGKAAASEKLGFLLRIQLLLSEVRPSLMSALPFLHPPPPLLSLLSHSLFAKIQMVYSPVNLNLHSDSYFQE